MYFTTVQKDALSVNKNGMLIPSNLRNAIYQPRIISKSINSNSQYPVKALLSYTA
jgi:hypothetical protein